MADEGEWEEMHGVKSPRLGREVVRVPVTVDLTATCRLERILPQDALQLIGQSGIAMEAQTLHGMRDLQDTFEPLDRLIYLYPAPESSAPARATDPSGGHHGTRPSSGVHPRPSSPALDLIERLHDQGYREHMDKGEPGADGATQPVWLPQTAAPMHSFHPRLVPFSLRYRVWADVRAARLNYARHHKPASPRDARTIPPDWGWSLSLLE
jgi:hypothetical protein